MTRLIQLVLITLCYLFGGTVVESSSCNITYDNLNHTKCVLSGPLGNGDYKGGDYHEIFRELELENQAYAYILINQKDKGNKHCYICVEYYNTSRHEYEVHDKVFVRYNEKTTSEGKKWNATLKPPKKYESTTTGQKYKISTTLSGNIFYSHFMLGLV